MLAASPPRESRTGSSCRCFRARGRIASTRRRSWRARAAIDRRIPVRLLNLAWHRLEWPPVEMARRRPLRRDALVASAAAAVATAAQVVTIHDLNFLSHPERTRAEIRRDYPSLARDHAHRADRVIVSSTFAAGEVEHVLGVPAEPDCRVPGRRARLVAAQDGAARRLRPVLRHARAAEERRRLARRVRAVDGGWQRRATTGADPELVLAGRATAEARPWLERIERPPLTGRRPPHRLRRAARTARRCTKAPACWSSRRSRKASA